MFFNGKHVCLTQMGNAGKLGKSDQDRLEDMFKVVNEKGTTKGLMSDVIGMPDAKDEEFIRKLIAIHEQMTGGLLGYTIRESRREWDLSKYASVHNDDATVNKASSMTYDMELPNSFVILVERYYPTMFRDRRHFRWLKRKLPGLMVKPNAKKADKRIK